MTKKKRGHPLIKPGCTPTSGPHEACKPAPQHRLGNGKKRREERETFVREHAGKIGELLVNDQYTLLGDAQGIYDFVTLKARPELRYSLNTHWTHIWYQLRGDYNRINKTEF